MYILHVCTNTVWFVLSHIFRFQIAVQILHADWYRFNHCLTVVICSIMLRLHIFPNVMISVTFFLYIFFLNNKLTLRIRILNSYLFAVVEMSHSHALCSRVCVLLLCSCVCVCVCAHACAIKVSVGGHRCLVCLSTERRHQVSVHIWGDLSPGPLLMMC